MKKKQLIQSANFKRDYVAYSAIVIFFLIIIAEVSLAVYIPTYLMKENVMALQVRRLQLLNSFDALRNSVRSASANELGKKELQLISWNLNLLADYLREHSGQLTSMEIAQLQETINEFHRIVDRIHKEGSYTQETTLSVKPYIDEILKDVQKK